MGQHHTPGEDTVDRLMARNQLERVSVPGGGEAFSGPLAGRALEALGGHMMTVDRTIIVPEDFDASNPEHMSLYAHEQYHQQQGSGEGGTHHIHDAEEVAARAVQRMVLHRAMKGGYEGGYAPGGGAGAGPSAPNASSDEGGRGVTDFNTAGGEKPEAVDHDPDARRGYLALKAQGLSHTDIVDKLARELIAVLDNQKESTMDRQVDKKGTF